MKNVIPNLSLIIFRKEFREIFRDKRTRMQVIISPLIITPLLFAVIGSFVKGKVEGTKSRTFSIGMVNREAFPELAKQLDLSLKFKVTSLKSVAEGTTLIHDRKQEAVVVLSQNTEEMLSKSQPVAVKILTDAGSEDSQNASRLLDGIFRKLNEGIVKTRLEQQNLSSTILTPFEVKEENIPGGGGGGMLFLTQMLPYFLILSIFSGSFYAAIDLVAGEKERNTLETLLVAPARRRDIALGKFGAIVSVCLISALLSTIGLMIPFVSGLKIYDWLAEGGLHLTATGIAVIGLSVLPISFLFAGLLLGISTFARNQKEAQGYVGSLFPILTLPILASLFLDGNTNPKIAFVPILNASMMIKQALSNNYQPAFIALAFASSVVYALIALVYVVKAFEKESVLLKA